MRIVSYNNPEENNGTNFLKFFNDELRKALWCELVVKEVLPFLIKHAQSDDLIRTLSFFFLETEKQVTQLEEVFSLLGIRMEEKECDIMKGITGMVWQVTNLTRGKVRDAAILLLVQKITSYQIVTHRTLSVFLRQTKQTKASYMIEATLAEKRNSDNKFHSLSNYINYAAMFSDIYNEEILKEDF